jgi:hypothetical protein
MLIAALDYFSSWIPELGFRDSSKQQSISCFRNPEKTVFYRIPDPGIKKAVDLGSATQFTGIGSDSSKREFGMYGKMQTEFQGNSSVSLSSQETLNAVF